jgi:hypothetical protein
MGFEVLTVVIMKSSVFWNIVDCWNDLYILLFQQPIVSIFVTSVFTVIIFLATGVHTIQEERD